MSLACLYFCICAFRMFLVHTGNIYFFHVPLGLRTKQWQRLSTKFKNLPAGICFHSVRRFRLRELCPSTCVTIQIRHLHPLLVSVVSCLGEEAARVRALETAIGHRTMNIFQWGSQKKCAINQISITADSWSYLLVLPFGLTTFDFQPLLVIRPLGTSSTSIKW